MTIPGIIMSLLIGSFLVVGILSSRMERRQKLFDQEKNAQQKAAEEKSKQDDLLFISSVEALLPDADSALGRLNDRYGWGKIVGAIGLSGLHLTILRMASYDGKMSLPNMQAERYEEGERYVAREVRKTTTTYDDIGFYGVDTYAQEPTAEMLGELIIAGCITTAAPITRNSRDFMCDLTPKGMALLDLDTRLRKHGNSQIYLHGISEVERHFISDVLHRCIRLRMDTIDLANNQKI